MTAHGYDRRRPSGFIKAEGMRRRPHADGRSAATRSTSASPASAPTRAGLAARPPRQQGDRQRAMSWSKATGRGSGGPTTCASTRPVTCSSWRTTPRATSLSRPHRQREPDLGTPAPPGGEQRTSCSSARRRTSPQGRGSRTTASCSTCRCRQTRRGVSHVIAIRAPKTLQRALRPLGPSLGPSGARRAPMGLRDLPRHAVRVVAAARRQRARRGRRGELRALGHEVTVLAPSTARGRPARRPAGARSAASGRGRDRASGRRVPISRRSSMGVPVGVRANLALALAPGRLRRRPRLRAGAAEPLVPRAARRATRSRVATLLLARPARLPAADARSASGCSARIDALARTLGRAPPRPRRSASPATTASSREGVDPELFRPATKRRAHRASSGARASAPLARAVAARAARAARTGSSCSCGRSRSPARPVRPARARGRVARADRARRRRSRARSCARRRSSSRRRTGCRASGSRRPAAGLRDRGAGAASPSSPSSRPRRSRGSPRTTRCASGRRRGARRRRAQSFAARRGELDALYARLAAPAPAAQPRTADPLADRDVDPRRPPHAHVWSHDCAIERRPISSTTRRRTASARSPSPTTTSSAARSRPSSSRATATSSSSRARRSRRTSQGEVIGLFLQEEIPRGHVVRRHGRGDPRAGRPRLPPPPVRPACTRSRTRRRSTATSPTSTSSRSTTRACSSRRYNDEALRFARKYDLIVGRRLRRARAAGRRHRRAADARVRRPGGVPPQPAHGRDPAAAEVARVPPEPEVDGPGQGKGPARRERTSRLRVRRRADRRDLRALPRTRRSPRSTSSGTRSRGAAEARACRCSARATRSPTSSCSSTAPQPPELQEGVAFFGRAGQAVLKSLQRLRVDPIEVYGTNCLKFAGGPRTSARRGCGASCTSSSRSSLVVMGEDALAFLNALELPALATRSSRELGELQRFTPTIEALVVPRHRRVARRAAGEDRVLERLQGRRRLVGRAAAVLVPRSRRRLAAAGPRSSPWYELDDRVPTCRPGRRGARRRSS